MAACDIACQRRKEEQRLGKEFVLATQNKEQDPEGYERARVAYYTVKEGSGWVADDKEKKANEKIQPILDSYQARFDEMKKAFIYQNAVEQATQDVMNGQVGDEDEVRFVHSEIEKEREQSSVTQRLNELAGMPVDVISWLPPFLDLLLGLSVLYIIYQIFAQGKLTALINNFTQTPG
jgi:hypothetical protein